MSRQRCVSACLAVLVALLLGATPALAHGPDVRGWLTTGDRTNLLAPKPANASPTAQTFNVDAPGHAPFSYTLPAGAVATFVLA